MKKIAILSGGTSLEREIALRSVEMFKEYVKRDYDFYIFPEQLDDFLKNRNLYDLVIPVFHGVYGEDGKIFAFLDVLGIKTTFSSFETHSLCLNKFITNELLKSIGVKIPKQFIYNKKLELDTFPLIVKPNKGGSSMFTYKVESKKDFFDKIKLINENVDDEILVQEFIKADEYSVSIVSGEILPIMKLQKQNQGDMFDYDNKYLDTPKIIETWPEIEINLKNNLENLSKKIYTFLSCKGYSRIDFLVMKNEIFFLEVNTIPGMTKTSIVPKSWLKTDRSLEELVQVIVDDL